MSGRRFFPTSIVDRASLGVAAFSGATALLLVITADDEVGYVLIGLNVVNCLFNLISAYAFPIRDMTSGQSGYESAISDLDNTRRAIKQLATFLDGERLRIEETEATLRRLQEESVSLEPLVTTKREAVDAILTAHTQVMRRGIWKERAVAFSMGVMASLVAGVILYWFGLGT